MSYELLLIAGHEQELAQQRRTVLIGHAAARIPGAVGHELVTTATATAAVVKTLPARGSYVRVERRGITTDVTLALSEPALNVAEQAPDAHLLGAEAAHIKFRLDSRGAATVTTDGLAFVPCFWAPLGGDLLVSTHLASLVSLGLPAEEDLRGLLEYLAALHPLQERTLLRRARVLPPGARLQWSRGEVTLRSDPYFKPSDVNLNDADAIAAFRHVWREVIASIIDRTRRERSAVALSGGLDSRAIVAVAPDLGWRPIAYTYGSSRNRDVIVASQVARQLRLPHLTVPVDGESLLLDARSMVSKLDGAHSPAEMYELWFAPLLRSIGDVIVNGLGGGQLWGDDKAVGVPDERAAVTKIWNRYASSAAAVRPFLLKELGDCFESEVRTSIAESVEHWDFAKRADAAVFWNIANRQRRWGGMLVNALRRSGLRIEVPFMDKHFLRFAAQLTPEQRRNGHLYLRVHREALATTARIARSDDGNSPQSLSHVYWSADQAIAGQLFSLSLRHPVSAGRRTLGQAAYVSAALLRRNTPLTWPADVLDQRRSAFPAELWLRTRPDYSQHLAALLESTIGTENSFSAVALEHAANELRLGHVPGPALVLAKVGTATGWLSDYAARETETRHMRK